MDRKLLDAYEVTPTLTQKWCVLVQVIERRNPKQKPNGPLYRNYVVTDTKGTKVPIIMFGRVIENFASMLEPYKRYYVSNAHVKETQERFMNLQYPYTWTLKKRNLVEPYLESIPPPLPCTFQFDKFSDLSRYADQNRAVCIKALIVHTLPVQESEHDSSFRECVVVNEEMIPMLIKVWSDVQFDTDVNVYARYNFPVLIIAYDLRVTTEHSLSMKTTTQSYFLENPPIQEEIPLKEWYHTHASEITSFIDTGAYMNPSKLFHPPSAAQILPLELAVSTIDNVKTTWTEGSVTFIPGQQKIWYEACVKCLTPLDVDTSWKIMCKYCKEYTKVTVRYEFNVFLSHGTTILPSSLTSPEADKLLPYTADEVRLAAEENKPLTDQIEAALNKKHAICFLKYYNRDNRGIIQRCYPILETYTEAELAEYNRAQRQIALDAVMSEDASEELAAISHIGTSSTTPNVAVERQMITPTMKNVLEETIQCPSSGETQSGHQTSAKRMLPFGEPEVGQQVQSSTSQIQQALTTPSQVNTPEEQTGNAANTTPPKRSKNKDKHP